MIDLYEMMHAKTPKGWKRNMGVFGWKGNELFIPCAAAGMSNTEAVLFAGFDGESVAAARGIILIRIAWARKERPKRAAVYDAIEQCAIQAKEAA